MKAPRSIGEVFRNFKKNGSAAFVPYITAGDPDLSATELFVRKLVEAGAAAVELGVPFSDPMADGPVNQRAAERALKKGVSLRAVLDLVDRLRTGGVTVPIILFTYFNPVFRMGLEAFAELAQASQVTGVLCVDLPPEEAADYLLQLERKGLEAIFLAAPTTDDERLRLIESSSTSVIYYVARTGVTGQQATLTAGLPEELARVRRVVSSRALMVGFGISNPEQAREVGEAADAVVVGSALVRLIEESVTVDEAARRLTEFSKGIVEALKSS